MRALAPRLLACAWLLAGAAQAHPYTVEDLLARQRLGPVTLAPGHRWLVAQSTDPYGTIRRFDLGPQAGLTVSRLDVVDLKGGGGARRLFAQDPDHGYVAGPYSPSGEKMAVTRVSGHDMELGLVTLATGQAVWTGLTPTANLFGRTLQWRSDDELVAVVRDPAAPSFTPVYDWQVQARLVEKWRATAEGRLGLTQIGSGRYLGRHAAPTPRTLVRVDARTGASRVLARGDFFDLQLSPDGAKVAVLLAAEDIQPDPAQLAGMAEPFRRHRLALIDLATTTTWSPCPACEFAIDLLAWSPSGAGLLVYGKADADPWSAARYWRITPASQDAAPLTLPDLAVAHDANVHGMRIPRGQWMGEDPLITGQTGPQGGLARRDWFRVTPLGPVALTRALPASAAKLVAVDREAALFSDGAALWRVTGDGRARRLADRTVAVNGPGLPGGERLLVNERPAPGDLVMTVPGPSGGARLATLRDGIVRAAGPALAAGEDLLAADAQAGVIAAVRTSAQGVETVTLRVGGRPPRDVLTINADLDEVDFSRPRPITHPGPGGKTLTSWLYLPPSLPAGRRAPLVVIPYPGDVRPDAAEGLGPPGQEGYPNPQILAGAGYAVLLPSLPTDLAREPMDGLAERILAVVDAVAASGAPIDSGRIALWGHSYGGYAVLAAATQSPRFKAIIAAAASPDLFVAYERDNLASSLTPDAGYTVANATGWLETGQARMGAAPWRDPDRYVRNSPILHADKITAPILLVTADLDGDAFGGRAMFNVLYRQGKDAMLLNYHGEGHQMFSAANLRDLYTRALAFLDDQLTAPAPAP